MGKAAPTTKSQKPHPRPLSLAMNPLIDRIEDPLTEARNEVKVLEALTELGTATAKAIAAKSGLTYLATRMALQRQLGLGCQRIGHKWQLSNGDADIEIGLNATRVAVLEQYLLMSNVDFIRVVQYPTSNPQRVYYSEPRPVKSLEIGDEINVATGKPLFRPVLAKTQQIGGTYYLELTNNTTRTYNPCDLVEIRRFVEFSEIDSMAEVLDAQAA